MMEWSWNSIAITLGCIAVVSFLWKAYYWVWLRPKNIEKHLKQQGLHGTSYNFLFGDAKHIFSARKDAQPPSGFSHDYFPRIFPFFHDTILNHGKMSYMWMGPVPMVNITDPELVREALSRMYDFRKPQMMNPLSRLLVPGLLSDEGAQWAAHRKLINPVFHISKLKLLLPAFGACGRELVGKWEEKMGESGRCEMDVWPHLESLTAETISRAAFSSSSHKGSKIFKLLKEQVEIVAIMRRSNYIPGTRFLPTQNNKRMKETDREVKKSLGYIISERKKELAMDEADDSTRTDMLSTLMELTSDDRQLIDDCKLFYLAGKDSTAKLLVWTMILLSRHQDWQARAREEVLSVFGPDALPDYDGIVNLKTVTMILYEVLRLYPPVVTLVRRAASDTKLGDVSLPAGTLVNLPLALVQHDDDLWGDDAKEFNPERFSQGISMATKSGKPSLLAFSAGPRVCVGQNFALIQAKMILSLILQRFSFELSPSYVHSPYVQLILQPQFGAPLILRRL